MTDGLDRLRFDPVVRSYDQDNNIRHSGAPGTHRGKRLVTRCIQERNFASVGFDVISTNVLRNTTGLTALNANLAGGDIAGGANTLRQTLVRPFPKRDPYAPPIPT